MNKTCLINQPAGIGDIILCQKIAHECQKRGFHVTWPVIPQYESIRDYLPDFEYIKQDSQFIGKDHYDSHNLIKEEDFIYIPLVRAAKLVKTNLIMYAKYELVGVDPTDWEDYVNLKRIPEREDSLYKHLGLDDEEYILVNDTFGSPPNTIKRTIPINDDRKRVSMKYVEGYTVFDWMKVIENASRIDIIDSSTTFLMNFVDLKAETVNVYSRTNKPQLDTNMQTQPLFDSKNKWNWLQM